jgi:hypothetical protein
MGVAFREVPKASVHSIPWLVWGGQSLINPHQIRNDGGEGPGDGSGVVFQVCDEQVSNCFEPVKTRLSLGVLRDEAAD